MRLYLSVALLHHTSQLHAIDTFCQRIHDICFDRYLNPRIEGAQVNMGLRDPNYAEEEVEVTEEDIKNL